MIPRLRTTSLSSVVIAAIATAMGGCAKKSSSSGQSTAAHPAAPSAPQSPSTGGNNAAGQALDVDTATVTAATATLRPPGAISLIVDQSASLALASAGGDYAAAQSQFYVDDQSMGPLDTVQTILCFVSNLGFWDDHVVNKGPYIAQFDMNQCQKNNGGSSSNGPKVDMINVIVNSTRDPDKPLNAKVWFQMANGGGGNTPQSFHVGVTVAEGPSPANPLGIFRVTFISDQMSADGSTVVTPGAQKGFLETKRDATSGNVSLSYAENDTNDGQGGSASSSAAVDLTIANNNVAGGVASLYQDATGQSNGQSQEQKDNFQVAFDNQHWATKDLQSSTNTCRDEHKFDVNVYQYGVYNMPSGSAVALNGGFPFTYGNGQYGYASYYGVNGDNGASIAAGTVVTKNVPGGTGAAPTYKVITGPGRLMKHTTTNLKLADIDGMELDGWTPNGQVRLQYSAAAGQFQETGTMSNSSGGNQGNNGPQWTNVNPPTTYTFSNGNNFSTPTGAQVVIALDSSNSPTGDVAVIDQQDVTASAGNLTLYCFQQCLVGNITQAMEQNAFGGGTPTPYNLPSSATQNGMTNTWAPWPLASPVSYTFTQSTYTLADSSGNPVALTGSSSSSNSQSNGGPSLGMQGLVDATVLHSMQSASTPVEAAGIQTVSYSWSVGDPSQPWTQFTGLVDSSGNPVNFSAPINIKYVYHVADDIGVGNTADDGKTFFMQFDGTNLQIPSHQDTDTGFWVNDFSISAGVTDASGAYIFKPLQGSKYMLSVDASNCSSLDPTKAPALPDFNTTYDDSKANHDPAPSATGLTTDFVSGQYVGS